MKSINEKYIPTDWLKETKLVPSNPIRSSFPKIESIDYNLFNLIIESDFKFGDGADSGSEDLTLSFIKDNNEIFFTQNSKLFKRNNDEQGGKEFLYGLKVIDHNAQAIMYYKIELQRVEIAKKEEANVVEDEPLEEHLEVIAQLDEDDVFKTEFGDPVDWDDEKK